MCSMRRVMWLVVPVIAGIICYTTASFAGSGGLDAWIQGKVKEAGAQKAYGSEKAKPEALSTSSILSHFKEKPAADTDSCSPPELLLDSVGNRIWQTVSQAKGSALRERFLLHARPDDVRPMLLVRTGLTAPAAADFDAAKKLVMESVLHGETSQCAISASRAQIAASEVEVLTGNDEVTAPWDRYWLFFIDDAPLANWGHDCRYVFVSPGLDTIAVQYARMPLRLRERGVNGESDRPLEVIVAYAPPKEPAPAVQDQPGIERGQELGFGNDVSRCYAVVISGGYDQANNHIRYWDDASFIYSTLTKKYGYADSHIYALISDGTNSRVDRSDGTNSPTDLDGDGDVDTDYAATLANVQTVFTQLASILTADDQLFVFITDHGNQVSGWSVYANLWGSVEILSDAQMKSMTQNLPCPVMFAMEQCFSGGFLDDLDQYNRCIATAAIYYRSSYSGNLYPNYNDWCYFWTAAVRGYKPGAQPWLDGTAVNADTNSDGRVSFKEASDYALANKYVGPGDFYDTPQYQANPSNLGEVLFLDKIATPPAPTIAPPTPAPTATPVPPSWCVTTAVDGTALSASDDTLNIWASVPEPIWSPCYIFFRVVSPYYGTYYLTINRGLVAYPAPYLPIAVIVTGPISNYYLGRLWWSNLLPGTYYLEAGAVNAYTPVIPSGFNYICDVHSLPLYFQ